MTVAAKKVTYSIPVMHFFLGRPSQSEPTTGTKNYWYASMPFSKPYVFGPDQCKKICVDYRQSIACTKTWHDASRPAYRSQTVCRDRANGL